MEKKETRSKHLPIPHFNRQKHHHKSRHPDTTSTQPKHTRPPTFQEPRARKGRHDSRDATEAGQHTADAASVNGIEQLGRGRIQHGVEVRLHDVLEGVETDIASRGPNLRVHGHGDTLTDGGEDERPLAT